MTRNDQTQLVVNGQSSQVVKGDNSNQKRRWRRRLFLLTIILGLYVIAIAWLNQNRVTIMQGMGHYLHYQSELKPADVIIVLSGGGSIRLEKGIELYQWNFAPRMLLAIPEQISPSAPGHDGLVTETTIYQGILKLRDVPSDIVHWSDQEFYSTIGEAIYIRDWLKENGYSSAIIVSGYFQSRRAKLTMDYIFHDMPEMEVMIAPAEHDYYDATNWWRSEEGFITVENEYLKLIYYYIKTWIGK